MRLFTACVEVCAAFTTAAKATIFTGEMVQSFTFVRHCVRRNDHSRLSSSVTGGFDAFLLAWEFDFWITLTRIR